MSTGLGVDLPQMPADGFAADAQLFGYLVETAGRGERARHSAFACAEPIHSARHLLRRFRPRLRVRNEYRRSSGRLVTVESEWERRNHDEEGPFQRGTCDRHRAAGSEALSTCRPHGIVEQRAQPEAFGEHRGHQTVRGDRQTIACGGDVPRGAIGEHDPTAMVYDDDAVAEEFQGIGQRGPRAIEMRQSVVHLHDAGEVREDRSNALDLEIFEWTSCRRSQHREAQEIVTALRNAGSESMERARGPEHGVVSTRCAGALRAAASAVRHRQIRDRAR